MARTDSTPPEPAPPLSAEQVRNARNGLILFGVYVVLYGGFVWMSAFARDAMAATVGGVNVATWYGFALIVAALVLALVYSVLCRDGLRESGDSGTSQ